MISNNSESEPAVTEAEETNTSDTVIPAVPPVDEPTGLYHRQLNLIDPNRLLLPVTVIGAGGIGSMTIIQLAKMGVQNLTVYDMDLVEEHNLPNSFFPADYKGKNKALAIGGVVYMFTGTVINCIQEKYEGQMFPTESIVIVAPDNMEARQSAWSKAKHTDILLYVDARMSAEFMDIYFVRPNVKEDVKFYESHTLNVKDEDTVADPCTARAIIYNTAGIGSLICNAVKRAVNKEANPTRIMFDYRTLTMQEVFSIPKPPPEPEHGVDGAA